MSNKIMFKFKPENQFLKIVIAQVICKCYMTIRIIRIKFQTKLTIINLILAKIYLLKVAQKEKIKISIYYRFSKKKR